MVFLKAKEQTTCNNPKAQFKRLSVFTTRRNFTAVSLPKLYTQANLLPCPLGKGGVETKNPQTESLAEKVTNQHHTDVSGHLLCQSRGVLLLFLTPFPLQHLTALCCAWAESLLPIQGTRSCWSHGYWNPGLAWPFFKRFWECYLSSVKVMRNSAVVSIAVMARDMPTHVHTHALGC